MEKLNKTILIGGVIALILLGFIAIKVNTTKESSVSSVNVGSSYKRMTTLATTSAAYVIKSGGGTFGSVIINTLGTGNVIFYDATTTDATQRKISATTSLSIVGVISASQAAGTYTYDASFYDGLMAVYSGAQGTSTLTWR
jgi:hypothetical protein